jgi:hypothetical protein
MEFEQLEQLVLQHTAELWDSDPKQSQLIQYTFPFVSLTDDDIEVMIRYIITNVLPKERFHNGAISMIQVSEPAVRYAILSIQLC